MNTPTFKKDIDTSSLSRENREKYVAILEAIKVAQDLDNQLNGISATAPNESLTPLADKLLQELEHHKVVKEILAEYSTVEETRKALLAEFERVQIAQTAKEEAKLELVNLLRTDGISEEILHRLDAPIEAQYTFKDVYWFEFFQKINESIQKNNTFWRPIAAGAFAQYLAVKKEIMKSEKPYERDLYNNTDFQYINAHTIEDVWINLPLSAETEQEVIDGFNKAITEWNVHDFLCSLEDKDLTARLRQHYELLKEAFHRNVLDIISKGKTPQYIYEAFVRTDLLRNAIKSSHSMGSPFTQLLILGREYDNWVLMKTIEHLLYACVAHKHDDNTNSGNFMYHVERCFELMGKKMDSKSLGHENFTAERLDVLRQHLRNTFL